MPSDADFDLVSIGSYEDNLCTPDLLEDFDFRGIRIHAPRRVALEGKPDDFDNFARAVVCGAYQLDSNYLGMQERFLPYLFFVAVDAKSHEARSGKLPIPQRPGGSVLPAGLTDADWEGRSVIEFFNPNLVSVLGLPEREAEYLVYVSLGDYVSNIVRMSLER